MRHSYKSRICVALRCRRYVALRHDCDFHINVAFMSQCDVAIRSQMCRSATFISMSHLCRIAMSRLCRSCVTRRLSYELLQCDIAFRSQMCRSAMSYCDLFAMYLRCRRWVAFRSQCDIHFGDIAATYISYWDNM